MGGYGSGWQGSRKTTVEEGLTLSIKRLVELRAIQLGERRQGTLSWSYSRQEPFARISYEAQVADPLDAWFRVLGRVNGEPVDYRIQLETTRPNFGGLRWWFICPCSGRRAAKLYLPPGAKYFAHRDVYGLTYQSCRESGQFRRMFRELASTTGMSEADVKFALRKGWLP